MYYGQFEYGSFVYLLLYVDDMLIPTKNMFEVKRMKCLSGDEFEMKNLGGVKKILELVGTWYDAHFRLLAVLAPRSEECSTSYVPYSSLVGSCTCPDIS